MMIRIGICCVVSCLAMMASGTRLMAVEAGHTEDFESGLAGWDGRPPTISDTGGPTGEGDAFLLVDAKGGNGPGSKLATFNNSADWTGDFSAAGITSIELDIMNMASSAGALDMRLVLFGPNSTGNRWTSTDPIVVPNDGQWQRISFPFDRQSLTSVGSPSTFDEMAQDVLRFMLRHDSGTPSETGTSIRALVGIDNITLVGAPGADSDFNGDGVVDVLDVDLLLGEIKSGTNDAKFDLTADGLVDTDDIQHIITLPDQLNTFVGDANLDGEFNTGDLVQILSTGQYEDNVPMNSTWGSGDWNGDAESSSDDLIFALQGGGYEAGPRDGTLAVAVPEPATCLLVLVGSMLVLLRWRGPERVVAPTR